MAVINCKICGSPLPSEDEVTTVCEHCGTLLTLPELNSSRQINFYNRANHFRRGNEYDKAMRIFDMLIGENDTGAEAYWSKVLCRYGIVYAQSDSEQWSPCIQRLQSGSVSEDSDYQAAMERADQQQKPLYEAEAALIEEIRSKMLEMSMRTAPCDVVVCCKGETEDDERICGFLLAQKLYHQLVQEGDQAFFASDLLMNEQPFNGEPQLYAALNNAKVMVVLGTKPEDFQNVWVKNQWSRFLSQIGDRTDKVLIPVCLDMDPYDLPEEFSGLEVQQLSELEEMYTLVCAIRKGTARDAAVNCTDDDASAVDYESTVSLLQYKAAMALMEAGNYVDAYEEFRNLKSYQDSNEKAKLLYRKSRWEKLKMAQPGDIVFFGRYAQEDFNQADEIAWYVLEIQEGKMLLIAKDGLDCLPYMESGGSADWNSSTLRTWLNTVFLRRAFSDLEQKTLCSSTVTADTNPYFDTPPGDETQDFVFLLSIAEAKRFLQTDGLNVCVPTAYAKNRGTVRISDDDSSWWWLRSPGYGPNVAAYVYGNTVCALGVDVSCSVGAVRPVVRMDLNALDSLLEADVQGDVEDNYVNYEYEKIKSAKPGDTIFFGSYQQSADLSVGKEKIEWRVLDVKRGRLLVMSKYGLDSKPYHSSFEDVTWQKSTLRKWLNHHFLNESFSEAEKLMIPTVTVSMDQNLYLHTRSVTSTRDKVFLLSSTEANKYREFTFLQQCLPTQYVMNDNEEFKDVSKCWWWLRSPGNYQNYASYVSNIGYINRSGNFVSGDYGIVRPAMWIDANAINESVSKAKQEIVIAYNKRSIEANTVSIKAAKPGDTIFFGCSKQDNNKIEWQVLDVKDGKALIFSKYSLANHAYHAKWEQITWEKCTLRRWLNRDFLDNTFSYDEKALITTTEEPGYCNVLYGTKYDATQDHVFLLSIDEVEKYWDTLRTSDHARKTCWWWLRSPGYDLGSAAYVRFNGEIAKAGSRVSDISGAVCPAMWIKFEP